MGGVLIYLAIRRGMEPALLLPMGFGAVLVQSGRTQGDASAAAGLGW